MATKDYSSQLEWDRAGQCRYRVLKTHKCTGEPGYSGGCQGRYTDDYGSTQSCRQCNGNGKIHSYKLIRVSEFDARRPAKNWVPDWVEDNGN